MALHGEIASAIGKRVSIRLRVTDSNGDSSGDSNGDSFRDLLGVLQNHPSAENTDQFTVVKKDGSASAFTPEDVAFFRVVPVFNRRDQESKELRIYDTRNRAVEVIAEPGAAVKVYCCGPTVYRDAHVGNMRTFLLTDLAARALEISGHEVLVVQNITDVGHMAEDLISEEISTGEENGGVSEGEDKVLEEGRRQSLTALAIAQKYEERFHLDLARLNIRPADHYPRASSSMELIIDSIKTLVEKGAAYVGTDGNVYFDVKSFDSYGAISGNKIEDLKPGHRYEYTGDGGKRFHADWVLWKLAKNRSEMVWDSPWGVGYPGWHIECSAMSLDLLGKTIDLHVGGIDLRFPHHENERAQTNSIAGVDAVAHWLHGEHLLFEGKKMSKSSGNVLLVTDIIEAGLDPLALRLALLENRYRSQMDLTWDSLRAADSTLQRWRKAMHSWGTSLEIKFDTELNSLLMNDLDTPRTLIRLRAIEKDMTIGIQDKRALFLYADQVLGLDLHLEPRAQAEISDEIKALLAERASARSAGNWSESDRIRDLLATMKIDVRDGKDGQSWELRN